MWYLSFLLFLLCGVFQEIGKYSIIKDGLGGCSKLQHFESSILKSQSLFQTFPPKLFTPPAQTTYSISQICSKTT
jgi:hypothetical protein